MTLRTKTELTATIERNALALAMLILHERDLDLARAAARRILESYSLRESNQTKGANNV